MKGGATSRQGAAAATARPPSPPAASAPAKMTATTAAPPVLAPDLQQYFLPVGRSTATVAFEPRVIGVAGLRFVDPKQGIDVSRESVFVTPFGDGAVPVNWDDATVTDLRLDQLASNPPCAGEFADLPRGAVSKRNYDAWSKDFLRWASQSQVVNLFKSSRTNLISKPGESEGDFRVRVRQAFREVRDKEVARLREKYASRIAAQTERVRRTEMSESRESIQASQQNWQTAISVGATVVTGAIGMLFGRKIVTASTIGKATTAARGVSRSMKESQDVARATENAQTEKDKLQSLETDLAAEIAALDTGDASSETLDSVTVRPRRGDVTVRLVALAWEARPRS
jgi:hypothetical protein